ncbi:MAG: AMIN domain-containing protein [Pseudohaliea sp.]
MVSPVQRFRHALACASVSGLLAAGSPAAGEEAPAGAAVAGSPLQLEAVRVGRDGDRFRVVFDLDGEPSYRVFSLAAPDRLVIDWAGAELGAPPAADAFRDSPVRAFRHAGRGGGDLRTVLDLSGELPYEVFTLKPHAGHGHRLVVDLYTDTDTGTGTGTGTDSDTGSGGQTAPVAASEASLPDEGAAASPAAAAPAAVAGARGPASAPPPAAPHREGAAPASAAGPAPAPVSAWAGLDARFGGTLQQEWAWATEREAHQKFETLLTPRLDLALGRGVDLTGILQLRLDAVGDLGPAAGEPSNYSDASVPWYNSERTSLFLRELYLDFRTGDTGWRLGKQQVVWGQADGLKVLDVVNPQSFREFILDDFDNSRIPLWMANITHPVGEAATLQLLWIPDTTYHELPDLTAPFAVRTPRLLPPLPVTALGPVDKPDDPFGDSDIGVALSGFAGGWDFSVNYLYRYLDNPVLPVRRRDDGRLELRQEYRRSHLLGGTFSTALGAFTVRGELAWNSDTYQPLDTLRDEAVGESAELSTVLGLDWTPSMDTLVSAQLFNSSLFDHDDAMARDAHEQLLTLLYQQDFANAAWRFRAIGLHSINDGDSLLQLKLRYWATSRLELWVGADLFAGERRGLFGQYGDEDRLLFGFEVGF